MHDEVRFGLLIALTVCLQSLVYSRVAAVVRACQFKIDDSLQPDEIPFCGQATANKIRDIARDGTTDVLEGHRYWCAMSMMYTSGHPRDLVSESTFQDCLRYIHTVPCTVCQVILHGW